MADIRVTLPKPEVRGVGSVLYRCATCGQTSPPEEQIVVDGKSYHPEHAPQEANRGG